MTKTRAFFLFLLSALSVMVNCSCTRTSHAAKTGAGNTPADLTEPMNGETHLPAWALAESQKRTLAQYIVHSHDWAQATRDAYTLAQRGPQALSQMPSLVLEDSDSYLHQVIIPHVCKTCRDAADTAAFISALHQLSGGDIFEFVAQYYLTDHSDSVAAWSFLWFFAHMEEEEAPYCRIIKNLIPQQGLDTTPYGKQILDMLGTQEFRPNDGRCLE